MGDYYGTLNEIRLGLEVDKRPEKPQAMKYVEQMDLFGIPLVAGGVLDQPHIFMLEYKIVKDYQQLMSVLLEAENATSDE